jgi:DNA polymerase-1
MAHHAEIGGAVGENLRKALDWLPTGRSLITVKRDVPLPVALHELTDGDGNGARLRGLVERFGFKSWLRELEGGAPEPQQKPARPSRARRSRRSPRRPSSRAARTAPF